MPQSIFSELPPEMQRRLPRSLVDVVKGQGVEISPEISLTKGPQVMSGY